MRNSTFNLRSQRIVLGIAALTGVASGLIAAPVAHAQCVGEWVVRDLGGGNRPPNSRSYGLAYDARREVSTLFGGGSFSSATSEWDGVAWTIVDTGTGPSGRNHPVLAYDSVREVTLMFGGDGNGGQTLFNDTWQWDGSTWTQINVVGPPPRTLFAAAFDSQRGVLVVFGGNLIDGTHVGDTWEFDGNQWSLTLPADSPSPRGGARMVYDSGRGVCVLFGGDANEGLNDYNGETWEYDGFNWTLVTDDGPPDRRIFAMAYDHDRDVTVIHGGQGDGGVTLEDTWEYDGFAWSPLSETSILGRRSEHGLIYETARGQMITYKGQGASQNDTHAWVDPRPYIGRHPADQSVNRGEPVIIAVDAGGADPLAYQWRRNGIPLNNGGTVSGATTDTLRISSASGGDQGDYDCVVSNSCGSLTSASAHLTVVANVTLEADFSCPGGGPYSVSWSGATPGGTVLLLFARNTGSYVIQTGQCAGTTTGLGTNQLRVVFQGNAGNNGSRTLSGSTSNSACGSYLQLLDAPTCLMSNVVRIQ